MPKHAFSFPRQLRTEVRRFVSKRISAVDASRFRQEPTYVTALISKLEGIAYDGLDGYVEFIPTVYDALGPGAAESKFGADFSFTGRISDRTQEVEKAILVQAKLGCIDHLDKDEEIRLHDQIHKMKKVVPAPKVMEIPEERGTRIPRIISGNRILSGDSYTRVRFEDYVVRRILTTLDGHTERQVVAAVQDSRLSTLRVNAHKSDSFR